MQESKETRKSYYIVSLLRKPIPLLSGERNHGKAADGDERRVLEGLLGLDGVESFRVLEALAGFDAHDGNFGIGWIDACHRARAHCGALIAGVVEDQFRSRLHLAQVLDGCRVGDAVPHGLTVADEIVEGVAVGLGFEEEVAHTQVSGVRGQPVTRRFSLYAATSSVLVSLPLDLALITARVSRYGELACVSSHGSPNAYLSHRLPRL